LIKTVQNAVGPFYLLHTGNLKFLAIFHKLAANEHGFLPNTSKI